MAFLYPSLVILSILLLLVPNVNCFDCYFCSSEKDKQCKHVSEVPCASPNVCVSMRREALTGKWIEKGCSKDGSCEAFKKDDKQVKYCMECSTNLCNTTTNLRFSFKIMSFLILIILFISL